jgi:hypothetical protein
MVNTAYPAPIKNILKATPAFVMYFLFSSLFVTALYDVVSHPHDRVERYHFRSNKFERLVRKRDEKLRYYYKPMIDWSPNDEKIISTRPLNRYG